jgi:hypothetical protein
MNVHIQLRQNPTREGFVAKSSVFLLVCIAPIRSAGNTKTGQRM